MSVANEWHREVDLPAKGRLEAGLEHTRELRDPGAIEEHLRHCAQCRHELTLVSAVRTRLRRLPKAAPSAALEGLAFAGLGEAGGPAAGEGRPRRWLLAAVGGWAAAATVGALFASHRSKDQLSATALPPMVDEMLREYDRASSSELPKVRPPGELEAALGHPIPYLQSADLRVVSDWLMAIRGEPSAAIAYNFRSCILIQFVVSEALFFRQPVVRESVSRTGAYFAQSGARVVFGRASRGLGSLVVGEMGPAVLEGLFPHTGLQRL